MIGEAHFLDFTNGLIHGDKNKCDQIVENLLAQKTDIRNIYVDLFQRSLYHVGRMWEQGQLCIADEHLGSEIIKSLMNRISAEIKAERKINKTALLACVDKEYHEIGARMAADIFELNGWKTYFLGSCTPTKEIINFIKFKKPDIVGLSFNFYMNILHLFRVIDDIRANYPNQKIIVGGQGVTRENVNPLKNYPDIKHFSTIKGLDEFLKTLSNN